MTFHEFPLPTDVYTVCDDPKTFIMRCTSGNNSHIRMYIVCKYDCIITQVYKRINVCFIVLDLKLTTALMLKYKKYVFCFTKLCQLELVLSEQSKIIFFEKSLSV